MNITTLNYVNKIYDKINNVVSTGGGAKIGNKIIIFQNQKYFVINHKQKEVEIKDGFAELIDAIIHAYSLAGEECKKENARNVFQYIKLQFLMILYGKERFMDLEEMTEAFYYKKRQLAFQNAYQK